jgi:RNA polymerase sigma-70 factor (ECF subfamily)
MDESAGQWPIDDKQSEPQPERARDDRWYKLILRTAAGEAQALTELYDESGTLVFSIASRILSNRADAEEITFDVYAYVWQSASRFDRSRGSVTTWLVMLTRSRALDRLRSISLRKTQTERGSNGNLPNISHALTFETSKHDSVMNALAQLEPADRELMHLVFYSGLSHSELAAKQGLPLGTVKTRVRAALGRLRKLMGDA